MNNRAHQVRQLPIQKANTYMPSDEAYFEMRTQRKMAGKQKGQQLPNSINKRKKGRCDYCGELIDLKTVWHIHHIIQRIHGVKVRITIW
jgi:5-methylcytosine-specific restriction endonuclease McrA